MAYLDHIGPFGEGGGGSRPYRFEARLRARWPENHPQRDAIFQIGQRWIAVEVATRLGSRQSPIEVAEATAYLAVEMVRLFDALQNRRNGCEAFCQGINFELDERCGPSSK